MNCSMEKRRTLGSEDALAEACHVKQSTVSRWIAGTQLPSQNRARDLARVLDIPLADILELLHEAGEQRLSDRMDDLERRVTTLEEQAHRRRG